MANRTRKHPRERRYRQTGTSRWEPAPAPERADTPARTVASTLQRLANPNMDWSKNMPSRGFPKKLVGRAKPRGNR